jgi:reactive intermediate/imine deaminase
MTIKIAYGMMAAALALTSFDVKAAEYLGAPPGMPFSSAVRVGDILYLSGEIGEGPDGKLVQGMEAQTKQTMENIAATLKKNGASYDDVFKCTVLLTDMSKWADFNKVYVRYFKPDRLPARSAVGANGLALGALVEVECWAHLSAKK